MSIFESLRDEDRPHQKLDVQIRDDMSKLRSMVVGDAERRRRAFLAQPKPTGSNLAALGLKLGRTLADLGPTWA
jgi:hypothetical protein